MAENIQFDVLVDTKNAEGQIKTLEQQIRELKGAIQKGSQDKGIVIKVDGAISSIEQVIKMVDTLQIELDKINAGFLKARNNAANKQAAAEHNAANKQAAAEHKIELAQARAQARAREKHNKEQMQKEVSLNKLKNAQKANNNAQYWKDQENQTKRRSRQLRVQMEQEAVRYKQVKTQPVSYGKQINNLSNLQQGWFQKYQHTGLDEYRAKYEAVGSAIKRVTNAQNEYNNAVKGAGVKIFRQEMDKLSQSTEYLGSLLQKLRSHMNWILAGGIIGGVVAIPTTFVATIKDIEEVMAGVRQVMPEIEHSQAKANKEMSEFINIASAYGEATKEIIDAGRSWSRMYGRGEDGVTNVNLLVSQSAKMAVADNFSLAESVRGLESAMAQFGMQSDNTNEIRLSTNRILDVWTRVAHTGAASASDLTNAVERAGASANQAGVSFEFFNALVSTGVRRTARSGAEVGQSLKSMFSSIHSAKAIKEIEKLGISVHSIDKDGSKSFRNVQDVILDLALAIQNTEKDTSALQLALGGGKWQVSKITAIMGDYQEIIRVWGEAVNSSGFTDQQIEIQMNTLSRKMKTLKAEIDGLFAETGNNGILQVLKDVADNASNAVRGAREFSYELAGLIKVAVYGAVGFGLVAKAIKMMGFHTGAHIAAQQIAKGATIDQISIESKLITTKMSLVAATYNQSLAQGAATASMNAEAVAASKAGVALTATSVAARTAATSVGILSVLTGNWVVILGLITYGIYDYVSAQGKAIKSQEDKIGLTEKEIEKNASLLEQGKKQEEFVEILSQKYNELSVEIKNNADATEENSKKTEQQKYIAEQLSKVLGIATDEFVKDGKIQIDVVAAIMKKRREEHIENAQNKLKEIADSIDATESLIEQTQTRIKALQAEMQACKTTGSWYQWLWDIIGKVQKTQANDYRKQADEIEAMSEEEIGNKYGNTGITFSPENLRKMADKADNDAEWSFGEKSFVANQMKLEKETVSLDESIKILEKLKGDAKKQTELYEAAIRSDKNMQGVLEDTEDTKEAEVFKDLPKRSNSSKEIPATITTNIPYGDIAYEEAQKRLGTPYLEGGDGVTSTDCGKLVLDSFKAAGIEFQNRYVPYMIEEAKDKGSWHPYGDGYIPQKGDAAVVPTSTGEDGHVVMANGLGGYIGANWSPQKVVYKDDIVADYGGVTGYISVNDLTGGATVPRVTQKDQERQERDQLKIIKDTDFMKSKLSADQYSRSLSDLSLIQDLYGNTVSGMVDKQNITRKRTNELSNENELYQRRIDILTNSINSMIGSDANLQASLSVTKEKWESMSKEDKRLFQYDNRDILESNKTLKNYVTTLNDYNEKASDTKNKITELNNEIIKTNFTGVFDKSKIYNRHIEQIGHNEKMEISSVANRKYSPDYNEDVRQARLHSLRAVKAEQEEHLLYLIEQKAIAEKYADEQAIRLTSELIVLEDELARVKDKNSDEYLDKVKNISNLRSSIDAYQNYETETIINAMLEMDKQNESIAETNITLAETADKWKDVRDQGASTFDSLIIQGNSFKDIWEDLWRGLAKDAINALFKVQNSNHGLFSSLLGVFGGGSKTSAWDAMGGFTPTFLKHSGGLITHNLPKMHNGGKVLEKPTLKDDEVNRTLQVGERVLSKDDNKRYESTMPKLIEQASHGATMVPDFNSEIMQQTKIVMAENKQTKAQISEIKQTNELLVAMLNKMNADGGSSGITVVSTHMSDQEILAAIQRNPAAMQGIIGKNRSMGYGR